MVASRGGRGGDVGSSSWFLVFKNELSCAQRRAFRHDRAHLMNRSWSVRLTAFIHYKHFFVMKRSVGQAALDTFVLISIVHKRNFDRAN